MLIKPIDITEWMKTQGYPLEMRVANLFCENDFTTAISEYYDDIDGKKKREIDVTAKLWSEHLFPVLLRISLNIECKKIQNPWILLKSKERGIFYEPYDISSTKLTKSVVFRFMQEPTLNSHIRRLPIYMKIPHYYGITEYNSGKGNQKPFEAMCSSSKAVINEIQQTDEFEHVHPELTFHQIGIIMPIIIIEGQLFEYKYLGDGEETNEINIGALRWKYYQREISMIDVVFCTERGIPELIAIIKDTMKELDDLIQNNKPIIDELVKKEAAQPPA